MAVAFNAGNGFSSIDIESMTCTPTAPAGSNRLLVVTIHWIDQSVSGLFIDTVTFNGVTMFLHGSAAGGHYAEMWYLINPATSGDVVITWGGDLGTGGASAIVGVVSFTGVDQTTPLGTMSGASGTSTSPSTSVTGTSTDNIVLDSCAKIDTSSNPTFTVGAGQTARWTLQSFTGGAGFYNGRGRGSTETSAVGSVTMSWTLGASRPWVIVAAEVKQVSSVTAALKDLIQGPGIIPFAR